MGLIPEFGRSPGRGKWQLPQVFLPEKVPWTEESGRLQSKESLRVGYNWATKHVMTYPYKQGLPITEDKWPIISCNKL